MRAFREHWPEYAMESLGLGLFMLAACGFTILIEHPASPVRQALAATLARRAVMGVAMGLTAVALIYSPWGRRSGAHLNPATTLAFWRLGRVRAPDAAAYVAAQFVGALAGVGLARAVAGRWLAHPSVHFATTRPGMAGFSAAFAAEAGISFVLISAVMRSASHPRLMPYTGWFAGALIATWIVLESPVSGMSMNPARTLGSASWAADWRGWWIYVTAPPLGMLAAAEVFRRSRAAGTGCAKLHHAPDVRCIFCGHRPGAATAAAPGTHS
jgi:aquaporin Z